MNKRTLYITDLDGTLLNDSAQLRSFSADILNQLLVQHGILLTIATARSYSSASSIVQGLCLKLPFATYNGAFLVRPEDGCILSKHSIEKSLLPTLIDSILKAEISPLVYSLIHG